MHFDETWHQLMEDGVEREYFVSADVYVSNAAGVNFPKPKKQGDDSRSKDKSSWLGLGKSLATSGHWRRAICKLTKEADSDRCFLNIYVDETILFQTVYIHLLRHTDIRPADNSLFFRKGCIAIYCIDAQRWAPANNPEPVYLQFNKPEVCNLWMSLLRAYAVPEIYGRWLRASRPTPDGEEGGSYRMWREIELTVIQGRNLGVTKVYDPSQDTDDPENNVELKDIDVSCEILLNDVPCARTTVKKGLGLPEWHETFIFSDVPPFESLELVIWKEKKVLKPSLVGTVIVDLITFRRAEPVEGWYPVQSANTASHAQIGELRLKIRVNEEIILPLSCYSALQHTLNTRNYLEWLSDLENKLQVKTLRSHFLYLAITRGDAVRQIREAATPEVEKAITSHQTIFRGNTVFSKTMEMCIAWYGSAFLEASIGGVLRKLCAAKVAIEVDPVRSGKGSRDVGRNVDQLVHWCKEFWEQIYSVRQECPRELRALLERVRILVEEHSRQADLPIDKQRQIPWQSVSAFVFLRFIVPAILHPHLFGLCPGLPSPPIQRSLKLVAKVIQSMANLNTADQKEISMGGIRDFMRDNLPRMMEYLEAVSTIDLETLHSSHKLEDPNDRRVLAYLQKRKETISVLDRESIPPFPHYLDRARELSIITSTVIRHSRDSFYKSRFRKLNDKNLEELCRKCFEVEEEALVRVNELATRLSEERRRATASAAWTRNYQPPKSPSIPSLGSTAIHVTDGPSRALTTTHNTSLSSVTVSSSTGGEQHQADTIISTSGYSNAHAVSISNQDWSGQLKVAERPATEGADEGAKRKRSFIRGFFGDKSYSKPRH